MSIRANDNYVERNENTLKISSLSSPFVVGDFIRTIYEGKKRGYKDFILDFSDVDRVYPNACVPLAGLIDYYRSNWNFSFDYQNISTFLEKTKTLEPPTLQDDRIQQR